MNCAECREGILDSIGQRCSDTVEEHISTCSSCRRFAAIQQTLHERFTSASSEELSRQFRFSLRARLTRAHTFAWPDYLPDIAHLGGGAIATAVSLLVLPFPALAVLIAGATFTGATYLLQSLLRDMFQDGH